MENHLSQWQIRVSCDKKAALFHRMVLEICLDSGELGLNVREMELGR